MAAGRAASRQAAAVTVRGSNSARARSTERIAGGVDCGVWGTQAAMLAPAAILADFAKVNPGFPAGSLALSCGNNRLTAGEGCMSRELQPMARRMVRGRRGEVGKITAG